MTNTELREIVQERDALISQVLASRNLIAAKNQQILKLEKEIIIADATISDLQSRLVKICGEFDISNQKAIYLKSLL